MNDYPPPAPDSLVDPATPFPGFGVAVLLCLLFLFCTQLPAALVGGALMIFFVVGNPGKFQGETDPMVMLATTEGSFAMAGGMLLAQIYVIGFSLLMLRYCFGPEWKRMVALRWPGWRVCLIVVASTPGFIFLGNVINNVLRRMLFSTQETTVPGMELMVELFQSWPATFAVLVVGFGPGIGEELWCRGFLGRGLVGRYGAVMGVVLTSFLFGAIHIDPCQGLMAMTMGLWLHYVYLTTRSLLMPMLLHTVNNSLAVLSTRLTSLDDLDRATGHLNQAAWWDQALPVLAALVLFAVVGWALYQTRGRLVARPGEVDWRPPFLSVECPPADSRVKVEQGRLTLVGGLLVLLAFAACVACLARMISLG